MNDDINDMIANMRKDFSPEELTIMDKFAEDMATKLSKMIADLDALEQKKIKNEIDEMTK